MGEGKDINLNRKDSVNEPSIGSPELMPVRLEAKYFGRKSEIVLAALQVIVAVTTLLVLGIIVFGENENSGQLFSNAGTLILASFAIIYGAVDLGLVMVRRRVNKRMAYQIALLERNQKKFLGGMTSGNFRSLRLAKIASRAEYEESMALDLDVMVARDGNLYAVGPDGNEKIVGEAEHKPKTITKKRFTIGG